MSITIADYLLTRLAELGVRHMFGVPGDFNLWFLEQTVENRDITFVGCCNELNAAYAADGCARVAGVAALATTYGVGELASLAGVAGAYAERVPIVCITGAPPAHAMRERALLHHTMADGNFDNTMNCYREFTVAHTRIEPATARREIDRVLQTCWQERRPVHLQLPSDVGGLRTEPITRPLELNLPCSDPRQLARATAKIAECLSRAHRPAILLDADVDRFGLIDPIIALAEANSIPVAHLIPAKGVISDTHTLSIGMYRGAASSPAVRAAVEDSDCLLCFGTRFTDVATGFFTHELNPKAVIELHPFSVKLRGESFTAVLAAELLSGLLAVTHRVSAPSARPLPHPSDAKDFAMDGALTQGIFWRQIQKYLQQRDVMVIDTGTCFFSAANLSLPEQVSFVAQPIWGALGYALPAVVGTCLAAPDRRQLVFLGDGALQMSAQELSTILRLDLKPVIFLLNNDGYTIERLIYGAKSSYNDISPWRYGEIPAVFDANGRAVVHLVRSSAELQTALREASDASKLHFIELVLSRMDAPETLVRFAKRAAAFDFPQILDRDGPETITEAYPAAKLPSADLKSSENTDLSLQRE
jgi:indolepyruvate decarboxylase